MFDKVLNTYATTYGIINDSFSNSGCLLDTMKEPSIVTIITDGTNLRVVLYRVDNVLPYSAIALPRLCNNAKQPYFIIIIAPLCNTRPIF